jgi:hypothetical protein
MAAMTMPSHLLYVRQLRSLDAGGDSAGGSGLGYGRERAQRECAEGSDEP